MTSSDQNIIHHSEFNFEYENEASASRCNILIESIFNTQILQELEKAISRHVPEGLYIELPKLEINIGQINEKEIPNYLARRIGTSLEKTLQNKLKLASNQANGISVDLGKSSNKYLVSLLEVFLEKGYFLAGIDDSFTIDDLITTIIRQNKSDFSGIFKKYRNYDAALNRIVLNLNSSTFNLVVQTLVPLNFNWVFDYRKIMLNIKNAGNIRHLSSDEFIRKLNFYILKYFSNQTSSVFISKNFSNYILKELKQLAGADFPLFIQAVEKNYGTFSTSEHNILKPTVVGKEKPEIKLENGDKEWKIEQLLELLNMGGKGLKGSKYHILKAIILKAIQQKEKREFLLDQLNKKGAIFLLGLFYTGNATALNNLINSFTTKVLKALTLNTVRIRGVKSNISTNNFVLHSVLYLSETSIRKISNEEFVLLLMYSAGVGVTETIASAAFRKFAETQNTISMENMLQLIQDEDQFPEILSIQKSLLKGKPPTQLNTINQDIRLTEEFINLSKRKIIFFYLDKGILPKEYSNLSWQDMQILFCDLLRRKDNFIAEQLKKDENHESLPIRLNKLITQKNVSDFEAYLTHFFKKEFALFTQFLNESVKQFSFKTKRTKTQKYIIELFIFALARSNGGTKANVFVLSFAENLFLELKQDSANASGFVDFTLEQFVNLSELSAAKNNKYPNVAIKEILEKDFSQILKFLDSVGYGEQSEQKKIKQLIKSLGFYFHVDRFAFLEILQKNRHKIIELLSLLKYYLPEKQWNQINKSLLSVAGLKQKLDVVELHSDWKSMSFGNLNQLKTGKANVLRSLFLTDEELFEKVISTAQDSGISEYLRFVDKNTHIIFSQLFNYFPALLSGKIGLELWKLLVLRCATFIFLDDKKANATTFINGFMHHFVQKLKSIQKTELFFPIVEGIKSSGGKELQEIVRVWQSLEKKELVEKNTTNKFEVNTSEKIRVYFSYLKFYAANGFFPWWAGNISFPEIIFEIREIRKTSPDAFDSLLKQLESDNDMFEMLLGKLQNSELTEFTLIFSDHALLAKNFKDIKKNQLKPEPFLQDIYFLTDKEIIDRWTDLDPKIADRINEYLSLAPWFYFRNLNSAQWRKTVVEFSRDYYRDKKVKLSNGFHDQFLNYLKQKYSSINWIKTFTKIYMMIKNSTSSNETGFPEALLQSLDISSDNFLSDNSENEISTNDDGNFVMVDNAGLILFWPFLIRLFENLSFLKNGNFVNAESRNRAVYLLQHLVCYEINFPEYKLVLNKLLVGMPAEEHLIPIDALNDEELEIAKSLLNGLISNWDKVANSTPEGIQETFLKREGILKFETEKVVLSVEKKGVDVLMNSIPWNISLIKLAWMQKPLHVEWI